jgi:hypothetical protein
MNWIKSHKLLTGIIALVVVIGGAAAAGGGSKKAATTAAGPTPAVSAPAAAATKAAVVPKVAATKDADKPTAAATKAEDKPKVKAIEHAEDVAITGCVADGDLGYLSAAVTVTNNSSKSSNYMVEIAFESKDGMKQLDTGLVMVNDLEAGQSSDQTAGGLKAAPAAGYNCKLVSVTRYAA